MNGFACLIYMIFATGCFTAGLMLLYCTPGAPVLGGSCSEQLAGAGAMFGLTVLCGVFGLSELEDD